MSSSSLLRRVSSLKVAWRRDRPLDGAIARDAHPRLCCRILHEILSSPGASLPLYYLERRRPRLRLAIRVRTFLIRHPNLLLLRPARLRPASDPTPFLSPSRRLLRFLVLRRRLLSLHAPLALSKLTRLLLMSRHRALPLSKLLDVRRDLGLPDDFASSLVPRHPDLLRLHASSGFLELVSWPGDLPRSAVERRADEEAALTGVRMRPNFEPQMPRGMLLRKEMREWTRDWLELPYISPYADSSGLRSGTPEMEKRMVGVLHELLSLVVFRRMPVASIGKFCDEFRFSNGFRSAFSRHPGIFYVSRKGGIETAVLREAYRDGELVDRDPLLEIWEKFVEMVEEGQREWMEQDKARRRAFEIERHRANRSGVALGVVGDELGGIVDNVE